MNDTKLWWQSRTVWVNIVAMLFALLSVGGMLPTGLDQDQAVTGIMAVIAVVNVILRFASRRVIA